MILAQAPEPEFPTYIFTIALGALLFVKFLGYLIASKSLHKAFPAPHSGIVGPAVVRTLIGAFGGYVYFMIWNFLGNHVIDGTFVHPTVIVLFFYAGMFVFRLAQWWVVLALFFPGALREPKRGWFCAIVGSLWSHFLDVPAMLTYAFVLTKLWPSMGPWTL